MIDLALTEPLLVGLVILVGVPLLAIMVLGLLFNLPLRHSRKRSLRTSTQAFPFRGHGLNLTDKGKQ